MLLQSQFFRSFLAVCLFFSYHTATAQGKLELKANLLPVLLESRAELSGEYLIGERIGIEAGIGYGWSTSKSRYRDTTSMSGGTIWTEIRQFREANYYLSGRYYFAPKQGGDRFLMGALTPRSSRSETEMPYAQHLSCNISLNHYQINRFNSQPSIFPRLSRSVTEILYAHLVKHYLYD